LLAGLTTELVSLKWPTSKRPTGPGVTQCHLGELVVVYLLIGLIWGLAGTGVVGVLSIASERPLQQRRAMSKCQWPVI
jgi:hypothetical protein